MRALWICNHIPAMIAQAAKMKQSNKEGWVDGALETLVRHSREITSAWEWRFLVLMRKAPRVRWRA